MLVVGPIVVLVDVLVEVEVLVDVDDVDVGPTVSANQAMVTVLLAHTRFAPYCANLARNVVAVYRSAPRNWAIGPPPSGDFTVTPTYVGTASRVWGTVT